jgi:hypothetical protein
MSLEEYLQKNIKPDILKEIADFQHSSSYKAIKDYTATTKYQTARTQLKFRDKNIHKHTLADIQRLQDSVLSVAY